MKTSGNFKFILDYANHSTALLLEQSKKQKAIRQLIRTALPDAIAEHLHECIIKGNKLILFTDSAAWASQLRFYQPMIQKIVTQQLSASIFIIQIRLSVHPNSVPTFAAKPQHLAPSTKTVTLLHDTIQTMQDSELKSALSRLENTLRKKLTQPAIPNDAS